LPRTVSMFSIRTLLVSSANFCSRPAKLFMLWQWAASALYNPSLHLYNGMLSCDAFASSGCWTKVLVTSDSTSSVIGANCEPVSVSSATLLASVLVAPKCALLSLICFLVLPGWDTKIFIFLMRFPWKRSFN